MEITTSYDTPLRTALERLGPHDHQSLIYESQEDRFAVAIAKLETHQGAFNRPISMHEHPQRDLAAAGQLGDRLTGRIHRSAQIVVFAFDHARSRQRDSGAGRPHARSAGGAGEKRNRQVDARAQARDQLIRPRIPQKWMPVCDRNRRNSSRNWLRKGQSGSSALVVRAPEPHFSGYNRALGPSRRCRRAASAAKTGFFSGS